MCATAMPRCQLCAYPHLDVRCAVQLLQTLSYIHDASRQRDLTAHCS